MSARAQTIPEGVRVLRLLLFSLLSGVAFFALVASFVGPIDLGGDKGPSELPETILLASAALLGGAILLSLAAGPPLRAMLATELKNGSLEDGAMPRAVFVWAILRAALFEAAGLLAGIALLLGGSPSCYFVLGFAMAGIFAQIRSEDSVRELIEGVRREQV